MTAAPLLITGATGTLGRAFDRICDVRGLPRVVSTRAQMDIAAPASVGAFLDATQPWAVVNTAGYVRVDQAESEPDACARENSGGPATLARACAERGIPLVTFSSDLVFDGAKRRPYVESDPVAPLNVYGRTKAEAERLVLAAHPAALVIRTSAFFGPWDEHNFVTIALRELADGRPFAAADDAVIAPTYVPDLVHASLDLLLDGERGVWHLANPGAVTWYELACDAARLAGLDPGGIEPRPTAAFGWPAPRPRYSALGSERGWIMAPLEDALARYFEEWERG
jgi:dTDP-4-dehydrorhamnose reductase